MGMFNKNTVIEKARRRYRGLKGKKTYDSK